MPRPANPDPVDRDIARFGPNGAAIAALFAQVKSLSGENIKALAKAQANVNQTVFQSAWGRAGGTDEGSLHTLGVVVGFGHAQIRDRLSGERGDIGPVIANGFAKAVLGAALACLGVGRLDAQEISTLSYAWRMVVK
jgi:hypothetical protein